MNYCKRFSRICNFCFSDFRDGVAQFQGKTERQTHLNCTYICQNNETCSRKNYENFQENNF